MRSSFFLDVTQRTFLFTDVSGQLSVQFSRVKQPKKNTGNTSVFLDYLTLEDWTDRLSRNVGD
jgi:hypothetical protein